MPTTARCWWQSSVREIHSPHDQRGLLPRKATSFGTELPLHVCSVLPWRVVRGAWSDERLDPRQGTTSQGQIILTSTRRGCCPACLRMSPQQFTRTTPSLEPLVRSVVLESRVHSYSARHCMPSCTVQRLSRRPAGMRPAKSCTMHP